MSRQEKELYDLQLIEDCEKLRQIAWENIEQVAKFTKELEAKNQEIEQKNIGLIELNKKLEMYKNPGREMMLDCVCLWVGDPIFKGEKSVNDNFIPGGAR